MKTTRYYRENVKKRRPDIKDEWVERTLLNSIDSEVEENGRIQHWGFIIEKSRYLRVVTLADGETVLNVMWDTYQED